MDNIYHKNDQNDQAEEVIYQGKVNYGEIIEDHIG